MESYQKPNWILRHVGNPFVTFLIERLGRGVRGGRLLVVAGRKTGAPRTAPVNPVEVGGRRYLVAPRGETEWVRNLRASGGGELRLGPAVERFRAEEIA